jgi:hypothetical protein
MFNQQSASQVSSQYRGKQRSFQPTGMVQSMYGQNQQLQNRQNQASQYQAQTPQSFHAANYQGNQPNHDQYLRSDSQSPSQIQNSFQPSQQFQSFGMANQQQFQQSQNQYQPVQSFHTASYKGNQPNHDQYLRSDSNSPAQMHQQFGKF